MFPWSSKAKKLQRAINEGDVEKVRALLNQGDVDVNNVDSDGWTPLHRASFCANGAVVQMLLEANADPNAVNKTGQTPLHVACSRHESEVVGVLLAGGANVHSKDQEGQEPIHLSIKFHEHSDCSDKTLSTLQLLVSNGATWDTAVEEMVASGTARKEALALRVCFSLWAQERADGLDLSSIPIEVIERGVDSTEAFIDALKTSLQIVLRRKICLAGSCNAGKTSFVKSITSEQPQLEHVDDRTIGIDHFPVRFEQSIISRSEAKIHEVAFWDFAGQDAYQVAHSLFFSARSMFLVFVDLEAFAKALNQTISMTSTGEQEAHPVDDYLERKVVHWVRLILARQPDAEIVFIATKEDLLKENEATEELVKQSLLAKLKEAEAATRELRKESETKETSKSPMHQEVDTKIPTVVFMSCASAASVQAARGHIQDLIIESERSLVMPEMYSEALQAIEGIRESAKRQDITTRIKRTFSPVDSLSAALDISPMLCRIILQTLHDLGDILWLEDLGIDLFRDTVILDPLLVIDFMRQVIEHQHTGQIIRHADLKSLPFWDGLNDNQHMEAMKQLLEKVDLVSSADDDRIMRWSSDLVVAGSGQTSTGSDDFN